MEVTGDFELTSDSPSSTVAFSTAINWIFVFLKDSPIFPIRRETDYEYSTQKSHKSFSILFIAFWSLKFFHIPTNFLENSGLK